MDPASIGNHCVPGMGGGGGGGGGGGAVLHSGLCLRGMLKSETTVILEIFYYYFNF